jgi:hypothetical protein
VRRQHTPSRVYTCAFVGRAPSLVLHQSSPEWKNMCFRRARGTGAWRVYRGVYRKRWSAGNAHIRGIAGCARLPKGSMGHGKHLPDKQHIRGWGAVAWSHRAGLHPHESAHCLLTSRLHTLSRRCTVRSGVTCASDILARVPARLSYSQTSLSHRQKD